MGVFTFHSKLRDLFCIFTFLYFGCVQSPGRNLFPLFLKMAGGAWIYKVSQIPFQHSVFRHFVFHKQRVKVIFDSINIFKVFYACYTINYHITSNFQKYINELCQKYLKNAQNVMFVSPKFTPPKVSGAWCMRKSQLS